MPHHAVLDGCGNLYLAYNNGSGPNGVTAGAVWRYTPATGAWTDVSPTRCQRPGSASAGSPPTPPIPGRWSSRRIDDWSPGEIYRTTDGGASWAPLVTAARSGTWRAPQWLYWHGTGLPARGWMGDVEIDPFDSSHALFITGQGLWSSDDVTAADSGAATHWTFADDGLEETVALDLASPPAAPPRPPSTPPLLTGVGDIGGFRHDDLDVSPPDGMFANPIFGNTNSLDFAESAPHHRRAGGDQLVVQGARTAPIRMDGGDDLGAVRRRPRGDHQHRTVVPTPRGIDRRLRRRHDVRLGLPERKGSARPPPPSYSPDTAPTGPPARGSPPGMLVAADRVNAVQVLRRAVTAEMYVSTDGGATFVPIDDHARPGGRVRCSASRGTSGSRPSIGPAALAGLGRDVPGRRRAVNGATAVGFGVPVDAGPDLPVRLPGGLGDPRRRGELRLGDLPLRRRAARPGSTSTIRSTSSATSTAWPAIRARPGRVYLGTSGRGIVYGDPQPQQRHNGTQ